MNKHNSISSNLLSSPQWYKQVVGALISSKTTIALLIGAIILLTTLYFTNRIACAFSGASVGAIVVWHVVKQLTPIYCIREEEHRITWSQIALLVSFGIWLLSLLYVIHPQKDSIESIGMTAIGILLGWIFQDTIKSVVAFFYLRSNDLLKINDWIIVPGKDIDGMVKSITLTTVTLTNWDTTTSSFPTYILHSEHFKNYQKMMDGKTEGRQMLKTFIIDTGWIHAMSHEELDKLKNILKNADDKFEYYITNEAKAGMLNVQLYREYLYHWLMHHPHVSQEPRLIVRWLEQTPDGLPLQIYAFITDSNLAPFEWQQSQIMEHAIEALAWFNIQLYQNASGYDASNSNIYLTKEPANYKKGQSNGDL